MCEYIMLEDFKMDKYIYDENNSLWYELQGGCYLPCLTWPSKEEKPIGIWGSDTSTHLQDHKIRRQSRIDCKNEEIDLLKVGLSGIAKKYGYQNVQEFYRIYHQPYSAYAAYREQEAEWEKIIKINISVEQRWMFC